MSTQPLTVPPRSEGLREFTPLEKLTLGAEIAVAYLRVRWLMRRRELREALATVRTPARSPLDGEADGEALFLARKLGSIVDGRLRILPGDTRCLARSLVLLRLLARRGLMGVLVIGVRTEPAFGAHAWVEFNGRPLLQPIEASGRRLVEL